MMTSSYIYILSKVAEVSRRFGVSLSDSEAQINWDDGRYVLSFPNGTPIDEARLSKYDRMVTALGIDAENGEVSAVDLDALNDIVDRALSIAPRIRSL